MSKKDTNNNKQNNNDNNDNPNSKGNDNINNIGCLWIKTDSYGNDYLSGKITIEDKEITLFINANRWKKQQNHPDWIVKLGSIKKVDENNKYKPNNNNGNVKNEEDDDF